MDAGHSRYEMNVWITAGNAGDSVCDMDGLSRSRNERVALDDGYKDAQHIARHNPARVLAECAAKRAIIEGAIPERDPQSGNPDYDPLWVIRELAAVYKDHPAYDPAWSSNGG